MINYYHKKTRQYLKQKRNIIFLTIGMIILNTVTVTVNYHIFKLLMLNCNIIFHNGLNYMKNWLLLIAIVADLMITTAIIDFSCDYIIAKINELKGMKEQASRMLLREIINDR